MSHLPTYPLFCSIGLSLLSPTRSRFTRTSSVRMALPSVSLKASLDTQQTSPQSAPPLPDEEHPHGHTGEDLDDATGAAAAAATADSAPTGDGVTTVAGGAAGGAAGDIGDFSTDVCVSVRVEAASSRVQDAPTAGKQPISYIWFQHQARNRNKAGGT